MGVTLWANNGGEVISTTVTRTVGGVPVIQRVDRYVGVTATGSDGHIYRAIGDEKASSSTDPSDALNKWYRGDLRWSFHADDARPQTWRRIIRYDPTLPISVTDHGTCTFDDP
jgi:hypothetical protein